MGLSVVFSVKTIDIYTYIHITISIYAYLYRYIHTYNYYLLLYFGHGLVVSMLDCKSRGSGFRSRSEQKYVLRFLHP